MRRCLPLLMLIYPIWLMAQTQSDRQFTILNEQAYRQTVAAAREQARQVIHELQPYRQLSLDQQIVLIVKQLSDKPYFASHAMGEGDWQPTATTYRGGAVHLNQNPVYRFDGFNCQTFVQTALALLKAHSLNEFEQTYLKIAYGAAGNPQGEIVHYYNRNHFIEADFNPVNQRNGLLADASNQSDLLPYRQTLQATLSKQNWIRNQQHHLADTIQVLQAKQAKAMISRFTHDYSHLPFPQFQPSRIAVTYLPKNSLVIREPDGTLLPNQALLNAIPTPSIVEMVRDPNRWRLFGERIKERIGTELTISHLGILYRQTFKQGEVIYQQTTCERNMPACQVKPVYCEQSHCRELMFAHATNVYPERYQWYQKPKGDYACTAKQPAPGTSATSCNRVIALPFFDYLTEQQYGFSINLDVPSVLGVHVEVVK